MNTPQNMASCRNLNYWDSVSTLAGEVPAPHKTIPRALAAAVGLVVVTYVVPLMVGLGVTAEIRDWRLGYFATIAKEARGSHLVIVFVITLGKPLLTLGAGDCMWPSWRRGWEGFCEISIRSYLSMPSMDEVGEKRVVKGG